MDDRPAPPPAPTSGRPVCRRCHRPLVGCICQHLAGIPRVQNQTGVVILQHPRERFHPLGTARIALLGLARVRLEMAGGPGSPGSLTRELELPPGTGLLYPHPDACPLESCSEQQRPRHLLLLDGTWANARKLYRANPWLRPLPHFCLRPTTPGRYRIRGEPDLHSRATIEAIIGALQVLEPETPGLDRLLSVFDAVIETQVVLARDSSGGPRTKLRRKPPTRRVPVPLLEHRERLVVAYCESTPGAGSRPRLVQLAATRPATGETFQRLLRPGATPIDPQHLDHMGLSPADLAHSVGPEQLARDWAEFLPLDPVLAAWNPGTLRLLPPAPEGAEPATVLLKAAFCNLRGEACGHLAHALQREGLTPHPVPIAGRAGRRLGQALAMLELLRS